jgi:lipopolysaccharide export system permease protein
MRLLVRQLAGSLDVVEAGKFMELGDRLIYVHAHGKEDCPLEGILIGDASSAERSFYAAARCGQIVGDPKGTQLTFLLHDGSIHFKDPDPTRYRRISFETMRTSIDISAYTEPPPVARDLRFSELVAARALAADDPRRKKLEGRLGTSLEVQFHRRLAFPLASLLLAVVAVPLGIRPVRAGRSMGALTAIAVMALYWLLFSLGEMAAERSVGPAWLGLWMPNAITLCLGVWLVRRMSRSDS